MRPRNGRHTSVESLDSTSYREARSSAVSSATIGSSATLRIAHAGAASRFRPAVALAGAVGLTGRAGTRMLMTSVFANPADLMRVLTLSLSGTPHLLGAAGESWHRLLGGPVAATAWACVGLAAWMFVPLAAARHAIHRRDL